MELCLSLTILLAVGPAYSNETNEVEQAATYSRKEIQKLYPGFGTEFLILLDGNGKPRIGFLTAPKEEGRIHFSEAPSDKNVKFTLYTKNNSPQIVTKKNISASAFDPNKKTKFILHGWMSNGQQETCMKIKDGYMKNYDYNVFIVDWGYYSDTLYYPGAVKDMKPVGKFFAKFISAVLKAGGKLDDIHLIGHSLGAQLSGYAAKEFTNNVGRITGLDPALPGFTDPKDRLNKTDANFVDIIHTCGGFVSIFEPMGHVDFYPNGGSAPQPGCGVLSEITEACSHGKSWEYFAATLRSEKPMKARKCKDYKTFKNNRKECENLINKVGEEAAPSKTGKFYFDTLPEAPYVKDLNKSR